MELKPGYKLTEVGVIPEDWEVRTIREFASVKGGKRLPLGKSLVDSPTSHPYVRVTDMYPGGVVLDGIKYVPDDVFPSIQNYRIYCNDLFISVAGTLGIVGRVPDLLDGANLTENADRITSITCDQDYLLYSLLSQRIQSIIEAERTVAAQPKLALGRIENFMIALPPTSTEQRAIARALGDVDALIGGLEKLIAKQRDLKQAAMQQLLTGRTRLPGFSGEWEVQRLGDVVDRFVNGGTPPTNLPAYWTGKIPWITGADILNQQVSEIRRYITEDAVRNSSTNVVHRGNLLLVSRTGVGKLAIAPFDVAISQDFTGVYVKRDCLVPVFLFRYFDFNSAVLQSQNQGTSIKGITRDTLASIPIRVPRLAEQHAIAEVLSDMDAEIAALEARLAKTRDLKQGMMQELLTGRIRLV